VRAEVIPYERDPRWTSHGPTAELVEELRERARAARLMTPHIVSDGSASHGGSSHGAHLSHRGTALVLRAAGLSPLGPVALNVSAPDEGNMFLLGRVASPEQQQQFGVLHDRAGRGRRRRLGSVDDEDHRRQGR
jgi:acyl-CoA dehydrogenase